MTSWKARPRKVKKRRRGPSITKTEAFKAQQRELFVKELTTVRTMTGADYRPDPSRAHECPWDE